MTQAPGPWRRVDPPGWAPPVGYSNAIESKAGRRISVAGQTSMGADGRIRHAGDLLSQARLAFENVCAVLRAAGAEPAHLVRLRIYVTDVDLYRTVAKEIGAHYRASFGKWFPAMTLVEVSRLYEPDAAIEVEAEAVVPE